MGQARNSKERRDPPFVYLVEHCPISQPMVAVFSIIVERTAWQTHRGSWRSPTQKISDFEVATMLLSEQELVMGKPQKSYDPPQEQSQAQATLEARLQGQGQAQLTVQALNPESGSNPIDDHHPL
jgi:hypothetical protein